MSWLKNVSMKRNSTVEKDWLTKMGIVEIAMDKNLQAASQEIALEDHATIQKLREKIVPDWYQELSDRQIKCADQFYQAVRDDYDYRTTHRVKDLLRQIGIKPVVHANILHKALEVSRGSDMAFLWFLLDINYFTFRRFTKDRG